MAFYEALGDGSLILPPTTNQRDISAYSKTACTIATSGIRSPSKAGSVYGVTATGTTFSFTEGVGSLTIGKATYWRFWLKKGSIDFVRARFRDNAVDYWVTVDMMNKAVGTDYSAGIQCEVLDMGAEWMQVTIIRTMAATSANIYLYGAEADGGDLVFSSTPSGVAFYVWNFERGVW